jgi:hypothetical protein
MKALLRGGGCSGKLKKMCNNYIASQFFPNDELGTTVSGFRNEDLTNQKFESKIFDLVVTQDVLEHVFNACRASIQRN